MSIALVTVVALGLAPWIAYLDVMPFIQHMMLERGGPGFPNGKPGPRAPRAVDGARVP